ncbi:hypothetical protein BD413DRAFT_494895 [Trametes elegans]|nr:hypothetical protein BD413DRAFT_494895 [Trametes elegans]
MTWRAVSETVMTQARTVELLFSQGLPRLSSAGSLVITPILQSNNSRTSQEEEDDLNQELEEAEARGAEPDSLSVGQSCPIAEGELDDDWEDADDDVPDVELNTLSPPMDTEVASGTPAPLPHIANTSNASSSPLPPTTKNPIPLDPQAMSRLDDHDPFHTAPMFDPSPTRTFEGSHPAVILAMLLVTWLHVIAHVPFRFCNAVLAVIRLILVECGHGALVPFVRASLAGCLSSLKLEPNIQLYPTCPSCLRPYPENIPATAKCLDCGHALFHPDSENLGQRAGARRHRRPCKPFLRTPAKSLTEQLGLLLAQPGMEEAMEGWRQRPRSAGWLYDFFDGAISRVLLGYDGMPFFRHDLVEDPDGELRVGIALGIDWFSYLRSLIAPSYTSCPMSFNVVNLPPHLRYRASNLLLSMIIPGPKETDPDQTQQYVNILVTHKMGGFGSHAHTFFCTRDWISKGLKATLVAFTHGGFAARTNDHHRRMMAEYRAKETRHAQEEYAQAYATRWSALARLPYFDMVRMIVVDPMHNLFLGLVKTHFYHIWIQLRIFRKTKELRRFHDILAKLNLPSKLGRLPRLVGEPAGGSLTADQWLILATVVSPLVLPEIWSEVLKSDFPESFLQERLTRIGKVTAIRKERQRAKRVKVKGGEKRKVTGSQCDSAGSLPHVTTAAQDLVLDHDDAGAMPDDNDNDWEDEEEEETSRPSELHPRDLENFLKLCAALRLYLSDCINEEQLLTADKLIRAYCIELIELYGPGVIRPNHHYATHTAEFVRDYGPLREFWTFLFERLNKLLKSYRTNNHEGGQIEATFFREFHWTAQLNRSVCYVAVLVNFPWHSSVLAAV